MSKPEQLKCEFDNRITNDAVMMNVRTYEGITQKHWDQALTLRCSKDLRHKRRVLSLRLVALGIAGGFANNSGYQTK